jgi:hypothetical protein
MGSAKDPEALQRYRRVLLNLGHVRDYIQWKRGALERVSRHLPNVAAELIHQLMIEHVREGGKIDQVVETREEYEWWKFHYDLRLPISGQRIYIETVFDNKEDDEDCVIYIVNIHPA